MTEKYSNQKIKSYETKHLLVENELKNYKHFIQFILEVKVILMKSVLKIIQCFSQHIDILKGLQVLVLVIIFIFGNLKNCLIKILQLLL